MFPPVRAGSDMATRNAISVADKDKERRLQDFEEEAVTRTMSSEQLDDGSVTTTNTTVSTQKSKGLWSTFRLVQCGPCDVVLQLVILCASPDFTRMTWYFRMVCFGPCHVILL